MRTTSMHFVNSLHNYLSSKVENRLLGVNEKNYSLGDTFKVALECELKAIASERRHAKCTTGSAYNKPTSTYSSNNNMPLSNSSDIVGEVTLKTSVDGYQLLKVNEMIKNAVAWRARMPKTNKISTYFNGNSKDATQKVQEPKVHINEATLEVMGQAAKDFGYMEQEFVEAVEMYQYFGNQNLEDVPIPNSQD